MTPSPHLLGLATAVPDHALAQGAVADRAWHWFNHAPPAELERMMGVFGNAGIDKRHSTVPLDWYDHPHGWAERNTLYLEHALNLIEKAARKAIAAAGLEPADIDAIVAVSTTGIATPSLDAMLMERMGLRRDLRRLPIFGLGCAGGVLGLSRAADLARVDPKARVLFVVVELCALSFRRDEFTKSNVVATALFGDGAAAAVVSCRGDGPVFGAAGEYTWPKSLGIMGWDVAEDGLKAIFSRDIPALVRRDLKRAVSDFLTKQDLDLAGIGHFICHPGGAKVIEALEEAFGLEAGTLVTARSVLRDYGNMSAATVMFVLERELRHGATGPMMMSALGPGFTAGFQLLNT